MRRTTAFLSVTALLTLAIFAFSNVGLATADNRADETVTIGNFFFTQQNVTINAGDTITWNNTQGFHNVASTDNTTFRCGENGCDQTGGTGNATSAPWTTQFTFDTAGVYDYICEIHPSMQGTITVLSTTAVGLNSAEAAAPLSVMPLILLAMLAVTTLAVRHKTTR